MALHGTITGSGHTIYEWTAVKKDTGQHCTYAVEVAHMTPETNEVAGVIEFDITHWEVDGLLALVAAILTEANVNLYPGRRPRSCSTPTT